MYIMILYNAYKCYPMCCSIKVRFVIMGALVNTVTGVLRVSKTFQFDSNVVECNYVIELI